MSTDLFERLADAPVPPPPAEQVFDRAVHERINQRLFAWQIIDFALKGFGFGIVHFAKALAGLVRLTFTGKFEDPKNRPSEP